MSSLCSNRFGVGFSMRGTMFSAFVRRSLRIFSWRKVRQFRFIVTAVVVIRSPRCRLASFLLPHASFGGEDYLM